MYNGISNANILVIPLLILNVVRRIYIIEWPEDDSIRVENVVRNNK